MSKEKFATSKLDVDPVVQSICYVEKMGGFNSLFLVGHQLNHEQLQHVAPVFKQMLDDYKVRRPFEDMPKEVKNDYKTKESFLDTRYEADKTNLGLVSDFLLNAAKVIGPEKLLGELRNGSKEPTKEEMYYAYAILRLGKYKSEAKPVDILTERDLDMISSSVDKIYCILESKKPSQA